MTEEGTNALVEISNAEQALQRASDIHEILVLRDQAAAYKVLADARGFKEAAQKAKLFQLKAERKAGEWLAENVNHVGNKFSTEYQDGTPLPEGITRNESSRWQLEASVPEEVFNEWVDECLSGDKEITASGLQRLGRTLRPTEAPELPEDKYRIIYADPPWKYGNEGLQQYGHASFHYPLMNIDELCAMPVKDIAEDNAVLFLWVTSPMLEDGFKVIRAWGFEYKTSFVWDKVGHNFGHYNSVRHEFLLVCTRGSCTPDTPILIDSVQSIEKSELHSQKPAEFRKIIDTLYTRGRKIELFAREKVDGWEVWGDDPSIR